MNTTKKRLWQKECFAGMVYVGNEDPMYTKELSPDDFVPFSAPGLAAIKEIADRIILDSRAQSPSGLDERKRSELLKLTVINHRAYPEGIIMRRTSSWSSDRQYSATPWLLS